MALDQGFHFFSYGPLFQKTNENYAQDLFLLFSLSVSFKAWPYDHPMAPVRLKSSPSPLQLTF